jgi:hypothetical protein
MLHSDEFSSLVADFISTIFLDEWHRLHEQSTAAIIKRNTVDALRSTKYAPTYQVSLNLMNGDSERLDVQWGVAESVDGMFSIGRWVLWRLTWHRYKNIQHTGNHFFHN